MDRRKAELAFPKRHICNPDGDGLFRWDHRVQHRNGDGGLAPSRRQAAASQLRADQVFIPEHGRLCLIAPALPNRLLPAHAAALGHELDVAVALDLGVAVAFVRTGHRRRPAVDGAAGQHHTPDSS